MTCKFVSFSIFRKPFGLRYIGCLEIYIYIDEEVFLLLISSIN
jgi:hypothetical protein